MTSRFSNSLAALGMVAAPTIMKFAQRHSPEVTTSERARGEPERDPTQRQCGTERWAIKIGTDAEARDVDVHKLHETTIQALRDLEEGDDADLDARVLPAEESVYVLRNVKLTHYKRETDVDYHLVIEDNRGNTMIAEIPEPGCVPKRAPWRTRIRAARAAFDDAHDVSGKMRSADDTVSLVGVGFFDVLHGQTGVAPNGIEIHPVLEICFGEDCKLDLAPKR